MIRLFVISFFVLIALLLFVNINSSKGNGSFDELNRDRQIIGSPFESSLSRSRFALTKSIAEDHRLDLDKFAQATFPDVIYANGHYYSVFIPGVSIYSVPLYILGSHFSLGVLAATLISPIAFFLSAIVLYLILKLLKFNYKLSMLMTFLMVFSTGVFTYSTSINAHPVSTFSVALAMYSLLLIIRNKNRIIGFPLLWLAFGLGVFADYPNAFTIAPFLYLAAKSAIRVVKLPEKRFLNISTYFLLTIVAALIFIVPLFLYVHHLFGSYFTTIEPHQIQGYVDNGVKKSVLLDDPASYLGKTIFYKTLKISPSYTVKGLYTLLVSLPRGIFIYTPIYLLAFLGIKSALKQNKSFTIAALFSIGLTIVLYASYTDYAGGWAFGPRFLISIAPIFSIFLAYSFKMHSSKTLYQVFLVVLAFISISISTLGAFTSRISLQSPLEGIGWGLNSSFFGNLKLIGKMPNTSFLFDGYLNRYVTSEFYFIMVLSLLLIIFLLLSIFAFQTKRRNIW